MRLIVVTPPAPFVAIADVRQHLRLGDDDSQDALVSAYIAAACESIDGPLTWLGRAIGMQTIEARLPAAGSCIRLPGKTVNELVSIAYLDAAGAEQSADIAGFDLLGADLFVPGSLWPWAAGISHPEGVRIRYKAGYQPDRVPAPIKVAVMLMVGDLFQNRETVAVGVSASAVPMSTTVETLLGPYRVFA